MSASTSAWVGTLRPRLLVAGLACAAVGLAPLVGLAADGVVEETNRRLVFTGEIGLALAAAANVDYAGMTRGGVPVFAFPPGTTPTQAQGQLDGAGPFRVRVQGPPGRHDELRPA